MTGIYLHGKSFLQVGAQTENILHESSNKEGCVKTTAGGDNGECAVVPSCHLVVIVAVIVVVVLRDRHMD
jgi:hypothetical protein